MRISITVVIINAMARVAFIKKAAIPKDRRSWVPIAHRTDELKQLRIIRQSCGQFHLQCGLFQAIEPKNRGGSLDGMSTPCE